MARGLFVTGTDTDAGKTVAACALLAVLSNLGRSAAGFKPVSAGAERTPDGLRNRDALWLQSYSSVPLDYPEINPVVLEPPIAPHIAAAATGLSLDFHRLLECRRHLGRRAEVVVTEGAGGWLVPLSAEADMSDLAAAIGDPVVLVVGMKLGCLNHARLTAASIRSRGCRLAGWIGNRLDPDMAAFQENLDALADFLRCPSIGLIPWLGDAPMERKVARASRSLDAALLETVLATD